MNEDDRKIVLMILISILNGPRVPSASNVALAKEGAERIMKAAGA